MNSHPNYRGYDAVQGKPAIRIAPRPSPSLLEHLGAVEVTDLPDKCPREWLSKVNAVRRWALKHELRFSMSPFEWQIAKIMSADWTIVLWNSRVKGSKTRYIKTAFEGIHGPNAQMAMRDITELVE